VLLDPVEEEFYLPAAFVNLSNRLSRECEVVGEKPEPLPGFDIEIAHPN
jgi:hypothetical protein